MRSDMNFALRYIFEIFLVKVPAPNMSTCLMNQKPQIQSNHEFTQKNSNRNRMCKDIFFLQKMPSLKSG